MKKHKRVDRMQRTPTEQELVSDIICSIAYGMIHEGYTADQVIELIENSSVEEIVEYYMDYDPDLLLENVTVSEEFISEQTEILEGILGAFARGAGGLLKKGLQGAKGLFKQGTKKLFGPGTRNRLKDAAVKVKDVVKTKVSPGASNLAKRAGRATVNTARAFALPAAVGYGLYKGGEKVADAIKDTKKDTAPATPQGGVAADKGGKRDPGIEAAGDKYGSKAMDFSKLLPKSAEPKSEPKKRGVRRSAMDLSGGLTKVQRNNRSIGR